MEFKFDIKFIDIVIFIACCCAVYSWYTGNKLHDKDFSSIDAIYHMVEACFMLLVIMVLK